jgi:hypothetical protein
MWYQGGPGCGQPTPGNTKLLGLAVQRMLAASRAKFLDLDAVRVVAPVFLCGVIAFLAITAGQSNDRTDIFL